MKISRGRLATGVVVAGLAVIGADRIVNFGGDSEAEKAAATATAAAFSSAVVAEMDARFANVQDPLDTRLFTFDQANSKLWIKDSKSRWEEAQSRVNSAFEDSLEVAGAGRGQDNHRDAAFACGMWILNNGVSDAAAFQPPTVEAYLHGDSTVATSRCLGAITARVARGELTQIQFFAGLAP
jgi:hypothetical protein